MESIDTPDGVRKREKVRAAWISFAGRIAAQIIGAIATVTLGVLVLGKGAVAKPAAQAEAHSQPTVLIATPVRTHGETVIVMLPLGKDGKVDEAMATQVAESYEKTKVDVTASAGGFIVPPLHEDALHAGAPRRTPTDRRALQSGDPSDDTRVTLESPHE